MEHEDSVGNGGSVEDQRPVEHDDAPRAAGAPLIDTSKAHSARVYNYILGGKDNYPVDVAAAEALLEAWPKLATSMRINRDTMQRMARWLAAEAGIRQFLDIGTGLPTEPNLHEVVQEVAPESRVVYVDNDPIVLAHARALLTSSPEGRTAYIDADMRSPWQVLEAPELRETLDLGRPIGVTVIAMLQFVEDAGNLVRQLTAALPKGSYLALTTATADITRDEVTAMAEEYTRRDVPMYLRTRSEVEGLFSGMEMVDPGVVPMNRWKPEPGVEIRDEDVNMYAGVGRVL
ncbi:SAM-dependent methyltransferase [Streptomyces sp. TS71-3]|uniref:SAM-dependent methyltransferase n=1 Tax=Streptomyces sp. TS71-3 TaxID=2733862 RepID=UPI001BB3EA6F|nr:SAM-dependent methyltransferase [Streptomyces sp. TS71-3]